jgi:hypothetical protein
MGLLLVLNNFIDFPLMDLIRHGLKSLFLLMNSNQGKVITSRTERVYIVPTTY